MNWILLSLLAPLFWTLSSFVDKHVLNKHTKGIFDFIFFTTVTSLIFVVVLFVFIGVPEFTIYSWIPVLTGVMLIYSYGFYGKALEGEDTSDLIVLYKLIPVVTLIMAFIFLGQTLSLRELLGFIVILSGAVIVSLERKKSFFVRGLGMIMIAILIWSVMTLLIDYGLTKMSFWHYFLLDNVGSVIAGPFMLLIPSMRKEIIEGLKTAKFKKYILFSWNNLLDFLGQMSAKKALAIAPSAGLVSVIMQVQSFYAIIIGVLLTLFLPNIIKEDISRRTLVKKVFGAIIMFSGIYILLK